ncbi:hypothetical protein BDY19DRAFT_712313 [Irpex rosettiformis]|uniref:Uncharacterized protein n=1 Tax=Irpex rosettiformis TaxID=378272 RepID=A0ACB8U850_9APHY|nr:hypothetical protein BDY19DRAFT_712313 [Irpex rosettiformis]
MGISDLPPELFEQILVHCDLRQILRFKAVSKSFNDFITNSARLRYHIDLFVSGFQDTHLNPTCNLHDRQAILSAAQNIWRIADSMALLETLHVSNLEYWPIRDSVLLRKVSALESPDPDSVTFDVSQISSCVGAMGATDVLSHWKVRLQKETGSIACIDPAQDLLIVRCNGAPHPINQPSSPFSSSSEATSPTGDLDADPGRYYCLSIHSLRTGEPHPRAKHPHIQFKMSQRVVKNPHYTRVQVLDNILAVNMASGFQLFTETTFFDWITGEMKSVISLFMSSNRILSEMIYRFSAHLGPLRERGAILQFSSLINVSYNHVTPLPNVDRRLKSMSSTITLVAAVSRTSREGDLVRHRTSRRTGSLASTTATCVSLSTSPLANKSLPTKRTKGFC